MNRDQRIDEQARELVSQMTLEERLGIPAYNWWNEALHGVARAGTATVFPQAIALAAAFDRALLGRVGDVIATEGRAKYNAQSARGDRDIYKGLTFWSPNVNIFRDPRWGRGHETYGEDPYLTGEMGAAFVEGIQQKDEKGYMKAAACAKHMAVHSGPESQRHSFDVSVSPKDLWETYLPAFEKLVVEAKVEGVMGAYNRLYGEPCCGSKLLLKDIVREKWGFEGYVTSDCGAIQDFHEHHKVTANVLESVALAIHNGCDLNCGGCYPYAVAAYENGMITEEEITQCAEHVMRTRLRLGLFDPECSYNAIGYDAVCCPEHIDAALNAARESIVLLKNDGILPLKGVKTLAVIGPNADNRTALVGNYHGTLDRCVTPLEGVYAAAEREDIRVFYSKGCELLRDRAESLAKENDRLAEVQAAAEQSDAVLLFLGLDETIEGEEGDADGDKESLALPACQRLLLEKVLEVGKPVVLVLMTGSAMDLREADERCAAVLQAWYPGARGGYAIADVLFGRVSPSGKLPVTFYRSTEDLPEFTNYDMKNRTYRYYTGEALYPFGYGLSYADIRLLSAEASEDGMTVRARVKNFSDFAAAEVVQVYVRDEESPFAPANPALCGFERVRLEAGEEKAVEVALSKHAYTVVNDRGERVPGSGSYAVWCGFNQPDARSEALTGKACVKIKK